MKRLKVNQQMMISLGLGAAALVVGFQNCANGYRFDAVTDQSVTKIDNVGAGVAGGSIPNMGDGGSTPPAVSPPSTIPPTGTPPGTTPPPVGVPPVASTPLPTAGDDDTRIDYDYGGRKMAFECTTGAEIKFSDADLLNAQDLQFFNGLGGPFEYLKPLRYVDIRNIRGDLFVKSAYQADRIEGISGRSAIVQAKTITNMLNLQTDVASASAIRLDGLYNVQGRSICASASEFGTASGLRASAIKFRGRPATAVGGANATAKTIGNVLGAFISIESLDVTKIEDIHGELIIRNANIDTIAGIEGGLTLINVKVKKLTNASGTLRMLNSSIGSQADMRMTVVNLPATAK